LVEILVAIAITGVIFTSLGTVIYQMTAYTEYGNDKLDVSHRLENAGYWFNRDGQMAVTASGGSSLSLTLPDANTITYSLSGTNLLRAAGASTINVAQDISAASFSVTGRLVTMNITGTIPGRMGVSETGTYQVYLRPVAP
jgi:hypothetical protein